MNLKVADKLRVEVLEPIFSSVVIKLFFFQDESTVRTEICYHTY